MLTPFRVRFQKRGNDLNGRKAHQVARDHMASGPFRFRSSEVNRLIKAFQQATGEKDVRVSFSWDGSLSVCRNPSGPLGTGSAEALSDDLGREFAEFEARHAKT
jgi:hypothetical protein